MEKFRKEVEIHSYAGLIYVDENEIEVIKKHQNYIVLKQQKV